MVLGIVGIPLSPARAQDQRSVEVRDNEYVSASITITLGQTVIWSVVGDHPHSVTSDDGSFDSSPTCLAGVGCLAKGDSFPHKFNSTGTFTYYCRVHQSIGMTGSVTVTSTTTTSAFTTTTAESTTTSTPGVSSTTLDSNQSTAITQGSLPSLSSTTRVALPKSIIRTTGGDDMTWWALGAIGIAGATTIVGVALVRRGRVPFG
jgi:plastocyanin